MIHVGLPSRVCFESRRVTLVSKHHDVLSQSYECKLCVVIYFFREKLRKSLEKFYNLNPIDLIRENKKKWRGRESDCELNENDPRRVGGIAYCEIAFMAPRKTFN